MTDYYQLYEKLTEELKAVGMDFSNLIDQRRNISEVLWRARAEDHKAVGKISYLERTLSRLNMAVRDYKAKMTTINNQLLNCRAQEQKQMGSFSSLLIDWFDPE